MNSHISTAWSLAVLLMISSCNVFELPEEKTTVPGRYFEENAIYELHFSDNCFYSEDYPHFICADYDQWVELSCLVAQGDGPSNFFCVFMGIPNKACKIENNRLIFSSRCSIKIHFASLLNDVFIVHSEHAAMAHIRGFGQLTEDSSAASGPIRVDLTLDDGERITLLFNHVTMKSILFR